MVQKTFYFELTRNISDHVTCHITLNQKTRKTVLELNTVSNFTLIMSPSTSTVYHLPVTRWCTRFGLNMFFVIDQRENMSMNLEHRLIVTSRIIDGDTISIGSTIEMCKVHRAKWTNLHKLDHVLLFLSQCHKTENAQNVRCSNMLRKSKNFTSKLE